MRRNCLFHSVLTSQLTSFWQDCKAIPAYGMIFSICLTSTLGLSLFSMMVVSTDTVYPEGTATPMALIDPVFNFRF